mmetsp:Transcript_109151/g.188900  ORF Transcript_109151/g.188900 Transcript_109151/m.188900 type:complete len:83 (+) Transcript_109151:136-384(+)
MVMVDSSMFCQKVDCFQARWEKIDERGSVKYYLIVKRTFPPDTTTISATLAIAATTKKLINSVPLVQHHELESIRRICTPWP